jgi:4-hydroxy-3-polyprenylbenzoate decarboxylase
MRSERKQLVLGITGASGAAYAVRLLDVLLAAGCDVHLSISASGQTLLRQELDLAVDLENFETSSLLPASTAAVVGQVKYHHHQDFMASIASGSYLTDGMVICPCSGSTVSAIACGASNNLIQRAADVHLKERRPLILVPRETPLSVIQLDNLKRCAEAGAVVLPAMPGFYHGARTIADLVDFVVARICDQLRIEHALIRRWGTTP